MASGYESPPESGGFFPGPVQSSQATAHGDRTATSQARPIRRKRQHGVSDTTAESRGHQMATHTPNPVVNTMLGAAKNIDDVIGNSFITGSVALYVHQMIHNVPIEDRVSPSDLDIVHFSRKRNVMPMIGYGWQIVGSSGDSTHGITFENRAVNFNVDLIHNGCFRTDPAQEVERRSLKYGNVRILSLDRLRDHYSDIVRDKDNKWEQAARKLHMADSILQ